MKPVLVTERVIESRGGSTSRSSIGPSAPAEISVSDLRRRRATHMSDLLRELVSRDMKLRYKRTVLGALWSLGHPLAQLVVLYFVFGHVMPLNIPNYLSFLFSGLLVWGWFSSSLMAAATSIVENGDLIRRPGFPAAILPTVVVSTQLIHFLFAIPVLLVWLAVDHVAVTPSLLALPLVIALQFAFTLGLAYAVATFHVGFRDTQYLLGIVLLLLFYLSPVFYDVAAVPDRFRLIYDLNPMSHILAEYRAVLLEGRWPSLGPMLGVAGLSLVLLVLGYFRFTRAGYRFIEEL